MPKKSKCFSKNIGLRPFRTGGYKTLHNQNYKFTQRYIVSIELLYFRESCCILLISSNGDIRVRALDHNVIH